MSKTVLSFYCDDTSPYSAPPGAFKTFLDFVAAEGIAGESSVILGFDWAERGVLLNRPSSDIEFDYIEQLQRTYACGIDSHFELMTHGGLFDFVNIQIPPAAIHEGIWLFEPANSVQAYEDYFGRILAEGERISVRFTGLTQPGCGCDACVRRHQELQTGNQIDPNPHVWQALLNLAKGGRFRGRTVPCFFGGSLEQGIPRRTASASPYAIFDLPPNARDRFGTWLNALDHVDPDYYITADGQAGRIVDLVRAHAPYCLFYSHWQGLNPGNGVGWEAFTQVIRRLQRFLRDDVIWMRPSEYTDSLSQV